MIDARARNEAPGPPVQFATLLDQLASARAKLGTVESRSEAGTIRTERLRVGPRSPLFPFGGPDRRAAEQYRIARTKITQHPKQPSMLVVSSAGVGDGKTVTAINLAAALALQTDGEVLLADADFRCSSVHEQLWLAPAPGMAELLEGRAGLEQVLIRAEQLPNLFVLQAGDPASNPSELLDSPRWRNLANEFRSFFRYIVVDSPPVAAVADYELIQAACDGTVLVLRPDHTRRSLAAEALKAIPKDKLIGVVMNWVPKWFLDRAGHPDSRSYDWRGDEPELRFPAFAPGK
jgi:protein-tyrosine kinase